MKGEVELLSEGIGIVSRVLECIWADELER